MIMPMLAVGQTNTKVNQVKPDLAPIKMVKETYFGKEVADPYRYMEQISDNDFSTWLKAQADYARTVLDNMPGRKDLLEKQWEFNERDGTRSYGLKITANDRYFYQKINPDDETGKLFFRDGFEGQESLLFDPEVYKKDTLSYTINSLQPSHDGSKIAIEVAANGTENSELLILSVSDAKLFPERIDKCWDASVSWLADGERFIYNRLNSNDIYDDARLLNTKLLLHTVGQSPDADLEIFSKGKYPELGIKEEEIPFGYYDTNNNLLIAMPLSVDIRMKAFVVSADDINTSNIPWKPLITEDDEVINFDTDVGYLYLLTSKGAPNFKIIKTKFGEPDIKNAEVVILNSKKYIIEDFVITEDGLYYTVSENGVKQELYVLDKGKKTPKKLELPTSAGRIKLSNKDEAHSDVWVTINGWTANNVRYSFDHDSGKFRKESLFPTPDYPEFKNLKVEEIMVPSHDGAQVPLSLVYDKNLKMDGNNPVLIFGYGAYGISMKPFFSPSYLLPTINGAIFAIAHVRGGAELGNDWHEAGFKTTKPNTWKDLIACSEYLIAKKYTSPKKVGIYSASAGGILIGRAMTERPDLFAVAISEVGSMNTLRSEFSPNGPVNIPEFGTVKDSVGFYALYEMDSYQHIVDGVNYPATLITAGINDPRVTYWEPAKFAARLQAANASDYPILFSVDFNAGHGMGDSKTTFFESMADVMGFFLWQTGDEGVQR